ncbi:ornithine cyclodeaminase family protein [Facklamia sp. 7083-14-GEN3]|uniref:ornithine cyclodeaminase family protein n=1 Tax=Facklamia sp. 7083-14-GEN3 TaxID=2973478 RepID=UPI00215C2BF3|nr:ornithine cyclodeaminase family protein [Facklamia sp. 7083-14-GEN3]MCR8969615.1 ornithine cyclodeaminase family protein [Facklamia sp. 7083-14-GEN3]
MRILKEADMQAVMTMKEAIQADKEALKLYSEGKTDIPLRSNIDVEAFEGQNLYMPGLAGSAAGIKIVSVYPNNIQKGITSVPATMVMLNEETGEVSALMDGTYLTRLRTGAVVGAATDLLANKEASVFALFGTGGQAQHQLEAILTVRPIKEVRVFDIDQERASEFAQKMMDLFAEKFDVKIVAVASPKEAVKDADIITTVTTAKTPVFDSEDLKKGVHINGVGSYTPEMQELPAEIFAKAGKIYLDTEDGVLNESGDLINPLKEGIIQKEDITGELGQLVAAKTAGRQSEDELTIFKTTGSAVLDIVVGKAIYKKAIEINKGQVIEM